MKIKITEAQAAKLSKSTEVFLGGTVGESTWRDTLIPLLKINYFNPVVKEWNDKAQQLEIKKRKTCDYVLYVITPFMEGVYSIAEVVDDSNKKPKQTILCVLSKDGDKEFTTHQIKSLKMVKSMVKDNGGMVFETLEEIAQKLNKI